MQGEDSLHLQKHQREQKIEFAQFEDFPSPKKLSKVVERSSHVEEYHSFFSQFPKKKDLKARLIDKLQKSSIFYSENQTLHAYQISMSDHSLTYEAVRLSVQITSFILEIVILNVKGSSSTHNLQNLSETKASIFQCASSKNTIIKCLSFSQIPFKDQLALAIKEYSLFKIASILGVGPKLNNIFGFDLVVYDQCIEFCMEQCTVLDAISENQSEQLIRKLQVLHELQIVHLDIKPQNICFSPIQQEMVFIDFGFSDVLAQQIGQLSATTFVGSLGYCCPEMMSCYNNQELTMIDLYYNDIFALKKSISELLRKAKDLNLVEQSRPFDGYFNDENKHLQDKVSGIFDLFFIKHALFTSSATLFKTPALIRKINRFKSQIILFTKQLSFSHFISELLNYFKMNFTDELFLHEQYQRKHFQLNKLINYGHKAQSIEGQLAEKYASFNKGIKIEQPNQTRTKLKVQLNLKELILSHKLSQQIGNEVYYENFVQFTCFTVAHSTFSEKVQACKILVSIAGWDIQQNLQEISYLGTCFKQLANYYLETASPKCCKTIPILLCNLVIIERISQDQLLTFLKKAVTINFSSRFKYALFLMRCSSIKIWTKERTMTKDLIIIMNYQFETIILVQFKKIMVQSDKYYPIISILFKLVNIFYDQKVSLTPKEYEQYKEFIKNSLIIDPELKVEINLFFFTIMMKFNTRNVDSTSSLCFMQQIILQQGIRRQKYQYFQYYHFIIFHFYQRTCNYKVLTHLIGNLNACLGNTSISERYSIYIYYTCMKFYQLQRGSNFYSFILNRLRSDSSEKQGQLLFYTVMVILHENSMFYLKNDVRNILNQIIEVLRQKFPLQNQTIIDINRNYIGNVFEMGYYLGVIVERVHRQNPATIDYLLNIREYLQSLVSNIPCVYCKERSILYLFTLEGFILKITNKTDDVVNLYNFILSQYKFQMVPTGFIFVAIQKILYYIIHERRTYYQALVEPMYKWMRANNCWRDMFILLSKNTTTFVHVNYYLITTQKYAQFFDIQFKLISVLPVYPSKLFTVAYAKGLTSVFKNVSTINKQGLIREYREGNYLNIKNTTYEIIIAAFMLQIWPIDDSFSQKLLKFIVNRINYVSNMAKLVTKQKIYAHLISLQLNKVNMITMKRSRFARYLFKQSLKYQPKQMEYKEFKYCLFNYPQLKQIKYEAKKRKILKLVKNYYSNLDLTVSYFQSQFQIKSHFTI